MSTRTQLIGIFTIAAAFAVATAMTPATATADSNNDNSEYNDNDNNYDYHHRGAPEVDPGTLGGAIALAMGGLAVFSDKLRRR